VATQLQAMKKAGAAPAAAPEPAAKPARKTLDLAAQAGGVAAGE
jgi:hypothetical protein